MTLCSDDLVAAYKEGNKNFALLFNRWMDGNEWSHPILIGLAKGACNGASWYHSSQISGIRSGKAQSPGPRQFIAIERVNRFLWEYKQHGKLMPGTTSSNNYKDAEPILTEDGECPDLGWFIEIFSGLRDLPNQYQGINNVFTRSQAEAFSQKYARLIRKLFVQQDLDLIENLDMTLLQYYPARDKPRLAKIKSVLTSPAVWLPEELSTELVALTSLSNALGGPSSEEELIAALA